MLSPKTVRLVGVGTSATGTTTGGAGSALATTSGRRPAAATTTMRNVSRRMSGSHHDEFAEHPWMERADEGVGPGREGRDTVDGRGRPQRDQAAVEQRS